MHEPAGSLLRRRGWGRGQHGDRRRRPDATRARSPHRDGHRDRGCGRRSPARPWTTWSSVAGTSARRTSSRPRSATASCPSTCCARSSRSSGRSSPGRAWSPPRSWAPPTRPTSSPPRRHREELEILARNVKDFKAAHKLDRVVIVNLGSTERHTEVSDVHRTVAAFEAGLQRSDERISPAMKYLYLACKLGAPHVNFTPSLTKIPGAGGAGRELGHPHRRRGREDRPDPPQDRARARLRGPPAAWSRAGSRPTSWATTTACVLDDPESNKTKVRQQALGARRDPRLRGRPTTRCTSTTTARAATRRRPGTTSTSPASSASGCR